MGDHGAFATASFLDCGLPSTAGAGDLAPFAKSILNHLDAFSPDIIVVELGDAVGRHGEDVRVDTPFGVRPTGGRILLGRGDQRLDREGHGAILVDVG